MNIENWNYDIWTKLEEWLVERGLAEHTADFTKTRKNIATAIATGALPADVIETIEAECAAAPTPLANLRFQKGIESMTTTKATAERIFGGNVRVRGEHEKYSEKRSTGRHKKTGEPVRGFDGREAELSSELDHAKLGALCKHLAIKSGVSAVMHEHERNLLLEMATKEVWVGDLGGQYVEVADGGMVKTLLDDNTSGGLEITPVSVDDQLVTFPLLQGEVWPFTDIQNVGRGRRIEGASIENVSINSGAGDSVETPLFNTANFVAAIDTTIFGCDCAVLVGLDFASDTIVDIGRVLTDLIGSATSAWLDNQCVNGDGTTEPEGLFVASNITTITTDNAAAGSPTLSDYYDLYFSIAKQYRVPQFGPMFISSDVTYARSKQVRVDPHAIGTTVNQTPVLSPVNNIGDYQTLGLRHAVQNDLSARRCMFAALKKCYRLYRRAGLALRIETGGVTLVRNNQMLVHARSRYGGKVVCTPAAAKWVDGQS